LTDDTVTSVDNGDSLEDFEAKFYGTSAPEESAPSEPEDQEEVETEESDEVETADLGEDDLPATDEDEADEEEDEEPQPKKNKVSARERIEQLNKQVREAERREADYIRRMEQLEAAIKEKAEEEQVPLRDQLPEAAPSPDAVDDKGDALYPLGEFDPKYIADLTQFTVEQRLKEAEEKRQVEEQRKAFDQERQELADQWIDRLDKFEAEVPEVRENIRELTDTFKDLDPGYGEYLAATLMSLDNGPQIMNYLSQNIGEAKKIVSSGPALATIAFGRLDAILTPAKEPEKKEKKTSKAPPPPEDRTRGSNGKFAVKPDTDNLDAFEKAFFS
jgi:DNA repair exonuclease SbcCD ATPase subunit